jgi:hypothetical protein
VCKNRFKEENKIGSYLPGTDVMIFKIFSPKKSAKKMFFFLEKRQVFRRKCAKIAENCDHNIDPASGK